MAGMDTADSMQEEMDNLSGEMEIPRKNNNKNKIAKNEKHYDGMKNAL